MTLYSHREFMRVSVKPRECEEKRTARVLLQELRYADTDGDNAVMRSSRLTHELWHQQSDTSES
jgi:hypothetical protein